MRKAYIFLAGAIFMLTGFTTVAQQFQQTILIQDARGELVGKRDHYLNVEGSPYLSSEWLTGDLKLPNLKVYKDLSIRYDEVEDLIYLKSGDDDNVMLKERPIEFNLAFPEEEGIIQRHFRLGFTDVPGTTPSSYFEVLEDGKVKLLKRSSKIIQQNKEYNSNITVKSFFHVITYYLYRDGKGIAVKKDKKSIFGALGDKQTELEAYVRNNKLNLKTDAGIEKLVGYYNTL